MEAQLFQAKMTEIDPPPDPDRAATSTGQIVILSLFVNTSAVFCIRMGPGPPWEKNETWNSVFSLTLSLTSAARGEDHAVAAAPLGS